MFVRSLNSKTLSSQLQAYSFSEAFDPPDNITASNDTAVQLLKRKMVSSLVSDVENYDHAQQQLARAALAKIYYESQFELAINKCRLLCESCNALLDCNYCIRGALMIVTNKQCVKDSDCPSGTYPNPFADPPQCQFCLPDNCDKCYPRTSCYQCSYGYYIFDSKCYAKDSCPPGTYPSDHTDPSSCIFCISQCSKCDNDQTC